MYTVSENQLLVLERLVTRDQDFRAELAVLKDSGFCLEEIRVYCQNGVVFFELWNNTLRFRAYKLVDKIKHDFGLFIEVGDEIKFLIIEDFDSSILDKDLNIFLDCGPAVLSKLFKAPVEFLSHPGLAINEEDIQRAPPKLKHALVKHFFDKA